MGAISYIPTRLSITRFWRTNSPFWLFNSVIHIVLQPWNSTRSVETQPPKPPHFERWIINTTLCTSAIVYQKPPTSLLGFARWDPNTNFAMWIATMWWINKVDSGWSLDILSWTSRFGAPRPLCSQTRITWAITQAYLGRSNSFTRTIRSWILTVGVTVPLLEASIWNEYGNTCNREPYTRICREFNMLPNTYWRRKGLPYYGLMKVYMNATP